MSNFFNRKHKMNQRISRKENVYDDNSKIMYGRVIRIYKREKSASYDPKIHAPETCHDVLWDGGKTEGGFFYHGLTIEEA